MNIKPLADRVLILPAPAEEKTIGGIIIPDTAKEKPLKGEVIAVGNGTKDEEMVLKVGIRYCMVNMPVRNWKWKEPSTSSCVKATYSLFWDNQFINSKPDK